MIVSTPTARTPWRQNNEYAVSRIRWRASLVTAGAVKPASVPDDLVLDDLVPGDLVAAIVITITGVRRRPERWT
jgi:hypothetical protein